MFLRAVCILIIKYFKFVLFDIKFSVKHISTKSILNSVKTCLKLIVKTTELEPTEPNYCFKYKNFYNYFLIMFGNGFSVNLRCQEKWKKWFLYIQKR